MTAPRWYDQSALSPTPTHTILFLAANPSDHAKLALGRESRRVEDKIRAAKYREHFAYTVLRDATPDDFQDRLLHDHPTIVHFSGHGIARQAGASSGRDFVEASDDAREGIALVAGERGATVIVGAQALRSTFADFRDQIRLVVLNACHSRALAEAVAEVVEFAIGIEGPIHDEAARLFSEGLYSGLGAGRSVAEAVGMGRSRMRLNGFHDDADRPELLCRADADADQVRMVDVGRSGSSSEPRERDAPSPDRRPASLREFSRNLDRHHQWAAFVQACERREHLVMWVVGDERQNVELLYDRIRGEFARQHDHDVFAFGSTDARYATAQEWSDLMRASVQEGMQRPLPELLGRAARERPAMFVLDSQRGAIEERGLEMPYIEELVAFVEQQFLPALAQAEPRNPVRLFLGIQAAGKSRLALLLHDVVQKARRRGAPRGLALADWSLTQRLGFPTVSEVVASIDEQLASSLTAMERELVEATYDSFSNSPSHKFRDLATSLYPHYERFFAARTEPDAP